MKKTKQRRGTSNSDFLQITQLKTNFENIFEHRRTKNSLKEKQDKNFVVKKEFTTLLL